jgi:16S rRNA G966 N2-methylase RsmD
LRQNLRITGLLSTDKAVVFRADVFHYLRNIAKKSIRFDIIFLDPPYKMKILRKCLHKISDYDILQLNGLIVAEHNVNEKIPQVVGALKLIRNIQSGKSKISIYKKEGK